MSALSAPGPVAPLTMDSLRECLEGPTPGVMSTCAPDGTPNVAYLSQIQYVDPHHLALSFQFFNKTRQNVLANPHGRLLVIHPATASMYRLDLEYLRTETAGPLFEVMRAKLAGIASHTGMAGVFKLQGSDVYRVHAIEAVPGRPLPPPPPRRSPLAALRATLQRIAHAADLATLLADALAALDAEFAIAHSMVLMLDGSGTRLYTVASRGYEQSGVGSEIPLGAGVIGVAARERVPIRIPHMTSEYGYGRAIREALEQGRHGALLETGIPLPGLPESRSQMAVPICANGRLHGVLYVESPQDLRFSYDDEDALVSLAMHLGLMVNAMQAAAERDEEPHAQAPAPEAACPQDAGPPLAVRHYRADDSVFLDDDYLIKGVAGAILWTLLRDFASRGRVSFSNRELRLDPRIRLPEIGDNLEARLVLLQRRLDERGACVRIEKIGRGRHRLCVGRPLTLEDVG